MKHTISNFYQYNSTLASGAQPSELEIHELKADGYEVIVNISPASTRNALQNEAHTVEKANMHYIHFPVDCSNLQHIHYNTFKAIMKEFSNNKTFVHCGGNIKSSNLLHMYEVLENKADEAESLFTLKKIQVPEEKWFDYFKSFGMKGLK